MRLGSRPRSQRIGRRLAHASRIPARHVLEHYVKPTACFVCGMPIWPGDEVLSRHYDGRVSCVTCPWPQEAIDRPTQ